MVEVRQGSWGDPLADLEGHLGGLVSNPPYIPAPEMLALQTEVGRCANDCRLSLSTSDGAAERAGHASRVRRALRA